MQSNHKNKTIFGIVRDKQTLYTEEQQFKWVMIYQISFQAICELYVEHIMRNAKWGYMESDCQENNNNPDVDDITQAEAWGAKSLWESKRGVWKGYTAPKHSENQDHMPNPLLYRNR